MFLCECVCCKESKCSNYLDGAKSKWIAISFMLIEQEALKDSYLQFEGCGLNGRSEMEVG